MLTLTLHASDPPDGPWHADRDGWRRGRSVVRPVAPTLLDLAAWTAPGRTVLLVARRDGEHGVPADHVPEPRPVTGEELAAAVAQARDGDRDHVLVDVVDRTSTRDAHVVVSAGCGSTTPVYLSVAGGALHGHWDLTTHLARTGGVLDDVLAAHYLHRSVPYSAATLWRGVHHLTERARATWTPTAPDRLDLRYPAPAPDVRPAQLQESVDPVATLRAGLRELVGGLLDADAPPWALELSGGADSAAVLAAAHDARLRAGHHGPLHTYGLLVPGARGAAQAARRAQLVERFAARDRTVPALRHPPLDPRGPRLAGGTVPGPHEEIYTEAFTALLTAAAADGARSVLTGTGGDELFLPHPDELTQDEAVAWTPPAAHVTPMAVAAFLDTRWTVDHAPRTAVPRSTLASLACRAPVFLRSGVLPVAPFAHTSVVRFCRLLPRPWRADKEVLRRYLGALGCPPEVARPRVHESFVDVFEGAVARRAGDLLAELFAAPLLADLGLVDADRLRADLAAHVTGHPVESHRFYEVAVLELALRRVHGAT